MTNAKLKQQQPQQQHHQPANPKTASAKNNTAKSTDATVFVKFTPASPHVTRHVLEAWFGEIGPIRKCAVIRESQRHASNNNTKDKQQQQQQQDDLINKGYGFVKFVSAQDAELAVQRLHGKTQPLTVGGGGGGGSHYQRNGANETMQIRLVVDLATTSHTNSSSSPTLPKREQRAEKKQTTAKPNTVEAKSKHGAAPKVTAPKPSLSTSSSSSSRNPPSKLERPQQQQQDRSSNKQLPKEDVVDQTDEATLLLNKKKKNRVIVRNLSFYAQEQHVRKELEERFGKIVDIHLPRVVVAVMEQDDPEKKKSNHKKPKGIHRGFCFVTFDTTDSAQQAVEASTTTAATDGSNHSAKSALLIHNRPVQIEWSVSKHIHEERTQHETKQLQTNKGGAKGKAQDKSQDDQEDSVMEESDQEEKLEEEEDDESVQGDESEDEDDDDQEEEDDESSSDDDEEDDASDDEDEDTKKENVEKKDASFGDINDKPDPAVAQHCCLFVRNLPFDATRHDLFEVFRSFGRIASIYLVKDKETGAPKGNAFVTYQDAASAQRALEKSGNQPTDKTATSITTSVGEKGLYLQGRQLVVYLAVDRDTASTLAMDKSSSNGNNHTLRGKDKRNLYLQTAGRVSRNDNESSSSSKRHASTHDGNSWDDLPESDQQKRQRAFADTSTKLKSPLFFINPNRLSIRNVAKHVDEADLKRLCVEATQKGLEKRLVSIEDQVAYWRAQGELTPRDILQRLQDNTPENAVIPEFNEKNVKQFVPSVYIDRDFDGSTKATGMSRGFGFVEFQHHVHALACLRELNNNTAYTEEYVAAGKKAIMAARSRKKRQKKGKKTDGADENVKLPRLIVEFTVENKAKAKQQTAHRAQQQANQEKQKKHPQDPGKEDGAMTKTSKQRKSRGAKQREKKRLQRDEPDETDAVPTDSDDAMEAKTTRQRGPNDVMNTLEEEEALLEATGAKQKIKAVKPPKKKRKVDKEEEKFDKMVDSYRTVFAEATEEKSEVAKRKEKRWFEEVA